MKQTLLRYSRFTLFAVFAAAALAANASIAQQQPAESTQCREDEVFAGDKGIQSRRNEVRRPQKKPGEKAIVVDRQLIPGVAVSHVDSVQKVPFRENSQSPAENGIIEVTVRLVCAVCADEFVVRPTYARNGTVLEARLEIAAIHSYSKGYDCTGTRSPRYFTFKLPVFGDQCFLSSRPESLAGVEFIFPAPFGKQHKVAVDCGEGWENVKARIVS